MGLMKAMRIKQQLWLGGDWLSWDRTILRKAIDACEGPNHIKHSMQDFLQLDHGVCVYMYMQDNPLSFCFLNFSFHLCTHKPGTGHCSGDSGGPLFRLNDNNRWKIVVMMNKFPVHQCQAQIEIWHSPDAHLTPTHSLSQGLNGGVKITNTFQTVGINSFFLYVQILDTDCIDGIPKHTQRHDFKESLSFI